MRYRLSIVCLIVTFAGYSQTKYALGGSLYYGGLVEDEVIIDFTGLSGFELRLTKYTDGSDPWESYHNFPKLEFGLTYFDYGVPDEFGQMITGVAGLNYPLLGENLKWSPGFGIGYSTKQYSENNRDNKEVSTKISFTTEFDVLYEIPLNNRSFLELALAFRHASNGNIKKPNQGMNFLVGGIAYHYDLRSSDRHKVNHESHPDHKTWNYNMIYAIGWKDPRVSPDNDLYRVHSVSFFGAYRFSNLNSFTLGLDGFLDTSQYQEYIYRKNEDPPFGENFDQKQLAFSFGNIFHFDRLSLITMAGLYLYRPYKFMPFSYQRYGFNYLLADRIILHSALKAYFGSADVIEFGVGVKL